MGSTTRPSPTGFGDWFFALGPLVEWVVVDCQKVGHVRCNEVYCLLAISQNILRHRYGIAQSF